MIQSFCAALVVASAPAWANLDSHDAASAAQQLSGGGRVLSVEKSATAGNAVWRVKLVTARGEVRVVLIDAASGRPL